MADSGGPTLFWHRRDLRTVDNVGLDGAARNGAVIPVYVVDPDLLRLAGEARQSFFVASLSALQSTYRDLGTDLIIRRGDPSAVIPELAAKFDVAAAVWNQDHSRYATERDFAVLDSLEDRGISVEETGDMTLHEPGSILTNAGDHYSVFSYYYRKWSDRDHPAPASQPADHAFQPVEGPTVTDVVDAPQAAPPLPAGRTAAVDRLQEFVGGPIYEYADRRDVPSAEGTSRLSQDLKFGTLGIREVMAETAAAAAAAPDDGAREGVQAFQRQLAWRDFYVQVLAGHPNTVWENFSTYENPIEWREDEAGFEAWTRGKTGYPIVDAGMRQLRAEGYMHNRVRMIVASFLTKDLQIDWRRGYRWFREQLVDHETANDVGGWQWAASTGTDAQPYFRVFNPMTQGERYDEEAEYITTHVPELDDVAPSTIHSWTDLSTAEREQAAPEYPAPIVDHASRRESAIEMFERARGGD